MDLFKAFGCLPHDLIIAKLEAYDFDNSALKLIASYLTGRKHDDILSLLKEVVSGVQQGSTLGPILFNIFINDLFFQFCSENLHNFTNDNTISTVSETIQGLIESLQTQTEIYWMDNNCMAADPEKSKCIIITKDRQDTLGINFELSGKIIEFCMKVEPLGISTDMKLTFDHHVSEICRKAGGQLNTLNTLMQRKFWLMLSYFLTLIIVL